jgi:hypothetical protein
LLGLAVEKLGQDILGGWGNDIWTGEVEGFRENLAVYFIGVLVVEYR